MSSIPSSSSYLPPFMNRISNPGTPINQVPALQTFGPSMHVDKVKGYDGALNYNMPPNSQTIVADEELPVVWFLATDQNGSKSMIKGFSISEYTPPKPVTLEDLMAEMRDMKERLNKIDGGNDDGKSHSRSDVKGQPNGAINQGSIRNGQSYSNGKPIRNDEQRGPENAGSK